MKRIYLIKKFNLFDFETLLDYSHYHTFPSGWDPTI